MWFKIDPAKMSSLVKLFLISSFCTYVVICDSWGYVKVNGKDVLTKFECFPFIKCPHGFKGLLQEMMNKEDISKKESDSSWPIIDNISTSTLLLGVFAFVILLIILIRCCHASKTRSSGAANQRNSSPSVTTSPQSNQYDPQLSYGRDNMEYVPTAPPEFAVVYSKHTEDHPPSYNEAMSEMHTERETATQKGTRGSGEIVRGRRNQSRNISTSSGRQDNYRRNWSRGLLPNAIRNQNDPSLSSLNANIAHSASPPPELAGVCKDVVEGSCDFIYEV